MRRSKLSCRNEETQQGLPTDASPQPQSFNPRLGSQRLAYGRKSTTLPRQFILVGTTNSLEFLRDVSHRRTPILRILGQVNLDALKRDRDLLLGETMALRHKWGDHVTLDPAFWKTAEQHSDEYRVVTPGEEAIRPGLNS